MLVGWIFLVCYSCSLGLAAVVAYRLKMGAKRRFFDKLRFSLIFLFSGSAAVESVWGFKTVILAFLGGLAGCLLFVWVGLELANRQLGKRVGQGGVTCGISSGELLL